jgi:hypothetical protein
MEFKWFDKNGNVIACFEKNKILNENMEEISRIIKDAHEDSVLMGVLDNSFKENIRLLFEEIQR